MTRSTSLGQGLSTLVDDEDYELLSRFKWRIVESGGNSKSMYAVATIRLHRLIVACPNDMMIDHINGNPLDNRKSNLRICSNSENQQNTSSRGGSSQYKNVSYSKRYDKWFAKFRFNGKEHFCGYHDTEEQARESVLKKRREICPNFSRSLSEVEP